MISCEEDLNALQYGSRSPRWLYYLDLVINNKANRHFDADGGNDIWQPEKKYFLHTHSSTEWMVRCFFQLFCNWLTNSADIVTVIFIFDYKKEFYVISHLLCFLNLGHPMNEGPKNGMIPFSFRALFLLMLSSANFQPTFNKHSAVWGWEKSYRYLAA